MPMLIKNRVSMRQRGREVEEWRTLGASKEQRGLNLKTGKIEFSGPSPLSLGLPPGVRNGALA